MNPVSTLVLSLALLFGGAGAVFAFESAAHSDAPASSVAAAAESASTPAEATPAARHGRRHHRGPVVRWAPCPAGTTLVENACVTDVVKTVTLPAPATQAVSHSSGSATSAHSSAHDDGGGEHGDEHGESDDDRGDDGGHHGGEGGDD